MSYIIGIHLLTGALVLILSQIDVKEIEEYGNNQYNFYDKMNNI